MSVTQKQRNGLTIVAHLTVSALALAGCGWALAGHAWHPVAQWTAIGMLLALLLGLSLFGGESKE